jgi:hypothetical protein
MFGWAHSRSGKGEWGAERVGEAGGAEGAGEVRAPHSKLKAQISTIQLTPTSVRDKKSPEVLILRDFLPTSKSSSRQ